MSRIKELELELERAREAGDEAAVYELTFYLEREIDRVLSEPECKL